MEQERKALSTVCCHRCGVLLAKSHEGMHKEYHENQDRNTAELLGKIRDVADRVTRLQESQQALARVVLRIEEKDNRLAKLCADGDNTLDGKITEIRNDVAEIVFTLKKGLAPDDWPLSWWERSEDRG